MNRKQTIFVSILSIGIVVAGIIFLRTKEQPTETSSVSERSNANEKHSGKASERRQGPLGAEVTQTQAGSVPDLEYAQKTLAAQAAYQQELSNRLKAQWDAPISFYGKVVDENELPITGALVDFTWNNSTDLATGQSSHSQAVSDQQGLFSLLNKNGKSLSVTVSKNGYYGTGDARIRSFEYGDPSIGIFVPEPAAPVIFHLRKKGSGEPLVTGLKLFGSRVDGSVSYVDLVQATNKPNPPGDLIVQFVRSERNSEGKFDWSFALAAPDGGLIESTNEFMFIAPADGYQPKFEINHKAGDADWKRQEQHRFFVKSEGGQHYSRINITIIPAYNNGAAYDLEWSLNPQGSRNLEPAQ
jgi:hypothetical protein